MSSSSVRVPAGPRRRSPLGVTLTVLAVVVVAVLLLAQVWTEVLWYDQLGFLEVLRTQWFTRGVLFLVGGALMALGVWSSITLGYRSRPIYAPTTPQQVALDQYREAIEPLRRLVTVAGPGLLGLFAGAAASQQWETVQLWLNQVPFGETDPEFGLDIAFFVFTLPGLRFVVSFLMAVVVLSGIVAVATHYLYGGVRTGGEGERTTRTARIHLASLGATLMVLVAANQWLDRYSLLTKQNDNVTGALYADVNAVMPSKAILTGVALLVAATFVVTAVRGSWRLPALGVGLMVVSAVVIGGIYPALVQRFQVAPNAQELEAEYYERNIEATKKAFGLDQVETIPYQATTEAVKGALADDAEPTASIRLLDPTIVSNSFRQLQQAKQYYDFADSLSVDRYVIEGESRDTVIAVRELNLAGLDQRNWVNDHTVYTHGYGVVAAYGNTTTTDGQPAFYERDIPAVGGLGEYEQRIYFGQNSPLYSIVGAPDEAGAWEHDYPADSDSGGQVTTSFPTDEVQAGPWIRDPWTKLLYALKFGDEEILFSDRVTSESQILYDRDPRARVQKVAPYLTLDQRVYPAVADGRIKWIVDGYTTTDAYPYAAQRALDEATVDSLTRSSDMIAELMPEMVSYIRNSVKATVDAFDGSVTLYAWDAEDPILRAWAKVFDTSLRPMSEISGDLMSHFRYPEDLFKVQRDLLGQYHVDDPREFFAGQDFWRTPDDPTKTDVRVPQPPYYLTLRMPGQDEATFSLTSTYIPAGSSGRNVLTGFLAVDAETGDSPGKVREGYGKLRLLELPRNSTVPGPGQMQNTFNSNPTVSTTLNILRSGGSNVINGNLLTLPVGGGLLYVQPVYVQASQGTRFPLLQKVLVGFGDKVGFADTLDEALDQVFEGDSGAQAGDAETERPEAPEPSPGTDPSAPEPTPGPTAEPTPGPEPTASPSSEPTSSPSAPADPRSALELALQDAAKAMQDADAALRAGDFAAYGEAQDRLADAIQRALAAEEALRG